MLHNQMKTLKDRVRDMLMRYPQYRDNDYKLMAHVWMIEMGGQEDCRNRTAMDFLQTYSKGTLSHAESIRRMRQKIQEQNPDLRGDKWQERSDMQQTIRMKITTL